MVIFNFAIANPKADTCTLINQAEFKIKCFQNFLCFNLKQKQLFTDNASRFENYI